MANIEMSDIVSRTGSPILARKNIPLHDEQQGGSDYVEVEDGDDDEGALLGGSHLSSPAERRPGRLWPGIVIEVCLDYPTHAPAVIVVIRPYRRFS
jgi:hypothetical protein